MTIQTGDFIPAVRIKYLTEGGLDEVSTEDLFTQGTSVLFGIPGCYTPVCSTEHVPSYLRNLDDLKAKGVDRVVCLGVNDPFVMREWLKSLHAEAIQALPDGNGVLTKAMGLEMDGSAYGLGTRTQRFAAIIRDGRIAHLAIEKPGVYDISSGEAILKALST